MGYWWMSFELVTRQIISRKYEELVGKICMVDLQVASACFIQPPLCYVGLTEEEAIEKLSGDIDVYTSKFKPLKNTLSGRDEKTLMKIIVQAETDTVSLFLHSRFILPTMNVRDIVNICDHDISNTFICCLSLGHSRLSMYGVVGMFAIRSAYDNLEAHIL